MRPGNQHSIAWAVAGAAGRRSSRGLTIVELLVVVSIIALMMTIGVGVWSTLRGAGGREGAFTGLLAACRRARVFSLQESAPSRLVIIRRAGEAHGFYAEGLRLVGFWHLEATADRGRPGAADPLTGFAGRRIEVTGGDFYNPDGSVVEGRRGTGLSLEQGGSVVLADEDVTLPYGGRFSFQFRPCPEMLDRKQVLLKRGRGLEFWMAPGGELKAQVGSAQISSGEYRLSPGPWHRLDLDFAPDEVSMAVGGVVRARTVPGEAVEMPEPREAYLPLEMGAGEWKLFGWLDEIAVYRSVREAEVRLPPDFSLVCDVEVVHFDSAGMLDRYYHGGPVRLGVAMPGEEGRKITRTIVVGLTGEIRED